MHRINKYKNIKYLLFFLCVGFSMHCITFHGYSQDIKLKIKNKKRVKLGGRIGLNFTDLYKTSPLNDPFKQKNTNGNNPYLGVDFGGMLGVLVNYNLLKNRMDVQFEIQYTMKGGSFNDNGNMSKVSFQYIEPHFNIGVKFFDVFVARAGGIFGYLVRAKSILKNTYISTDKEPYVPTLFGAMVSLGYLNWDGFFADVKMEIDFTNVNNTAFEGRDFFLGNVLYQITAGYFLPL